MLNNLNPRPPSPASTPLLPGCTPASWTGYDHGAGQVCGDCAALVNVRDNGGTCSEFCSRQGLSCSDAWDDTTEEQCSLDAPRLGCSHQFSYTSDAICQCAAGTLQDPNAPCRCLFTSRPVLLYRGSACAQNLQHICQLQNFPFASCALNPSLDHGASHRHDGHPAVVATGCRLVLHGLRDRAPGAAI